jgi:hypothetical protein
LTQNLHFHARFGGLDWSADLPLVQFDCAPTGAAGAVALSRQSALVPIDQARRIGRAVIGSDRVQFAWGEIATFELHGADRIGWVPGSGWREQLPVSFFSSVAAIALAWRGIVPLHASTIVLGGQAWLIAGNPGAGKSTLAAELVGAGASLLADDLTALSPGPQPLAWRGRPTMRLHRDAIGYIEHSGAPEPTDDARGKMLIRPVARAADQPWPVGGILLLGEPPSPDFGSVGTAIAVGSLLFRPRIVAALPGRARMRAGLLDLARSVPMALLPAVTQFDQAARTARVAAALKAIERLAGSKSTR